MVELSSNESPSVMDRLPNHHAQAMNNNLSSPSALHQAHANHHSPEDENVSPLFFLSKQAMREIPRYQYKGEDRSLIYHYVLSPLATFCVHRLTPRWVAPNAITLTGLLFMVAAYLAMWYYVPTLSAPVEEDELTKSSPPRWIFLLNAVSMLVYQTLDNMDGKQARRTGSSSPLGMLFDHGCDAINSLFGSANWLVAMDLQPATSTLDLCLCASILFGPYALFYIGTWEEYYTGQLILPVFNGPNEGLLGGVMLSWTSVVHGSAFWQQHDVWEQYMRPLLDGVLPGHSFWRLRNADLMVLFCTFLFVQEVVLKSIFVARTYGAKTLWNLLPFVLWMTCFVVVASVDASVWLDQPRTSIHLCAILFVEMATALMLAHVSKQPFQPVRWILLPLVLLTVAVVVGAGTARSEGGRRLMADYVLMYATAAGTYLTMKIVVVVHEICVVLEIKCFTIARTGGKSQPPSSLDDSKKAN